MKFHIVYSPKQLRWFVICGQRQDCKGFSYLRSANDYKEAYSWVP